MLLYDLNFRITSFDMIEPLPCVLFFPMYFLVLAEKTEGNFQILKLTPTLITEVAKILLHFL